MAHIFIIVRFRFRSLSLFSPHLLVNKATMSVFAKTVMKALQ